MQEIKVLGMTVDEIARMIDVCHMKFGGMPTEIPFTYKESMKHLKRIADLEQTIKDLREPISAICEETGGYMFRVS